jgi:Flp pilus assembly protein TadB
MSSTTHVAGRLLEAGSPADAQGRHNAPVADPDLASEWNALEKDRRRQIRRLIRIGQAQQDTGDAALAVRFAAFQRTRPWYRFFWLWIVPLAIAGVVAGGALHPVVIGLVLGAVVSAVMVRRNFRRVEKVNTDLLDEPR